MKTSTANRSRSASPACSPLRVLRLTLKRKWFLMIASGEKKEEYRAETPWIMSRLQGKDYDMVEFRNGYSAFCPMVRVEYIGWSIDYGRLDWGAGFDPLVVIKLGDIIPENAKRLAHADENQSDQ